MRNSRKQTVESFEEKSLVFFNEKRLNFYFWYSKKSTHRLLKYENSQLFLIYSNPDRMQRMRF